MNVEYGLFIWHHDKELNNIAKHGVDFFKASKVFSDNKRLILNDDKNSRDEDRFFCIRKVGQQILTVRFTVRGNQIRIIGAGFWRNGKKLYEEKNKIFK